jgi:hypothetical protein
LVVTISVCCWAFGCSWEKKPERNESWEMFAFPGGNVIAVCPALNYSGNTTFDPVIVGDLMASELSTLPGVGVIGVSRVAAILAEQNLARIQSPQHALQVCSRLGADAILVFAVTEYDPYTPVVGITAQLYSLHGRQETLGLPPPGSEPGVPTTAPAGGLPIRPVAECQRLFNATHERVRNAVREYADKRREGDSPYDWQKYVASQEWYLRFCCYTVVRDLLKPVNGFGVVRVTE